MSKLGKKPIDIPKDTNVKIENGILILNGPKGSKQLTINEKIFSASVSDNKKIILKIIKKNELSNRMWGTTRSLINSAVIGVGVGFEKILELTGVGFRAMLKGDVINFQLGFSHDIQFKIPADVKIVIEKNTIIKISGTDKQVVGKVASDIKLLKPIEPYKGKGIKERGQFVFRKEGKKK
jgi:large subunit ribosomal protein L6